MSYVFKDVTRKSLLSDPESLTAVAEVQRSVAFVPQQLDRIMFLVTTAVVSTGAVAIQFILRQFDGAGSGDVVIGTLSIPAGAAQGAVYYKDIESVEVKVGQEIVTKVSTAAAGGSAAGAGVSSYEASESADVPLNQSNMILSS